MNDKALIDLIQSNNNVNLTLAVCIVGSEYTADLMVNKMLNQDTLIFSTAYVQSDFAGWIEVPELDADEWLNSENDRIAQVKSYYKINNVITIRETLNVNSDTKTYEKSSLVIRHLNTDFEYIGTTMVHKGSCKKDEFVKYLAEQLNKLKDE